MTYKIYLVEAEWDTKEAEDHAWMGANVSGYSADSWAKKEWSKHPTEAKWYLGIPKGHPDTGTGEDLTGDWVPEEAR